MLTPSGIVFSWVVLYVFHFYSLIMELSYDRKKGGGFERFYMFHQNSTSSLQMFIDLYWHYLGPWYSVLTDVKAFSFEQHTLSAGHVQYQFCYLTCKWYLNYNLFSLTIFSNHMIWDMVDFKIVWEEMWHLCFSEF